MKNLIHLINFHFHSIIIGIFLHALSSICYLIILIFFTAADLLNMLSAYDHMSISVCLLGTFANKFRINNLLNI